MDLHSFSNVLPFLRWDDLFRLRATCFEAKCMVDAYFEQQKKMDLSVVQCKFNGEALKVIFILFKKLLVLQIYNIYNTCVTVRKNKYAFFDIGMQTANREYDMKKISKWHICRFNMLV